MSQKSTQSKTTPAAYDPLIAFAPFTPVAWMGSAWFSNLAELGTELTSFVAERIQEDVQTQNALMHCKSLSEVQHVQAEFLQKAFDQYQAETGKLIEMTGRMAVQMRTGGKIGA